MVPLTVSSCIYFTTGPIFAGLLGLVCICEMLSCREFTIIMLSLVGTLMVTVPHWFVFLGLDDNDGDSNDVSKRFSKDVEGTGEIYYYMGVSMSAGSILLDACSNFLTRIMGVMQSDVSVSFLPFFQGSVIFILTVIYIMIWDRESLSEPTMEAYLYAFAAGVISWVAQESLILGSMSSKLALGTFAQQTGFVIPILFYSCIM